MEGRVPASLDRTDQFLRNANFTISSCLGGREHVVFPLRNDFYRFGSLSSLIDYHVIIFAEVASHLIETETTINVHWDCPQGMNIGFLGYYGISKRVVYGI